MNSSFYSMFGNPASSFKEQLFRDLQERHHCKDKIDVIYVIFGRRGDDPGLLEWLANFSQDDLVFRSKIRKDTPFNRIANDDNNHDFVMGYVFAGPNSIEKDLDPEFTWAALAGFTVNKFYMNELRELDISNLTCVA